MRASVRKLGNSSGVIIPKSLLAEAGVAVGDTVDMTLEEGRIVLAPVRGAGREQAGPKHRKRLPQLGDDALVWPEFANFDGRNARLVRRSAPVGAARCAAGASAVNRGEIWLAVLDPTVGSEIRKTRPCVIVSPPEMHDFLRTVTVAPMTTGSHQAPYRMPVRFRGKDGLILLDQMRTLDKQRLVRRLGAVSGNTLRLTLAALREMFEE